MILGDDTAKLHKTISAVFENLKSNKIFDRFHVRLLSFSLPYHLTAHKITQALIYLLDTKGH